MKQETISKLLSINRQFYQTFAKEFDATRQRIQPGVARGLERVLDMIPSNARILDLGCGNGELARELARRGFAGTYTGVDFSEGLIVAASGEWRVASGRQYQFEIRDLTMADWEVGLEGPFDVVFAFAVLHHLPAPFHAEIMRKVRILLLRQHPERNEVFGMQSKDAGGQDAFPSPHPSTSLPKPRSAQDAPNSPRLFPSFPLPLFIHSNWQFLNSPRWRARIQPWERVGLSADDVDPDDYLLDWRRGGEGLRYVHHFTQAELARLAEEAGFEVVETFESDGAEGNLGLYQIWTLSSQSSRNAKFVKESPLT